MSKLKKFDRLFEETSQELFWKHLNELFIPQLIKSFAANSEDYKLIQIAKACHTVNRMWCIVNKDDSQVSFKEASDQIQDSAIKGVEFRLANPDATPELQHEAWSKSKIENGWVYGKKKNEEKKTHNCLVPYSELPEFQRIKDQLFQAVCDTLI